MSTGTFALLLYSVVYRTVQISLLCVYERSLTGFPSLQLHEILESVQEKLLMNTMHN